MLVNNKSMSVSKLLGLVCLISCMLFSGAVNAETQPEKADKISAPCSKVKTVEHTGFYTQDPMIRISSLPLDKDIDKVLLAVSEDVSEYTGLEKEFITYYWADFTNINCMGKTVKDQGPILVDLYVPGFLTTEMIGKIMTSLAASLECHTGIDKKWVFIHTHFPRQKDVYISGEIQTWDDYQGDKE